MTTFSGLNSLFRGKMWSLLWSIWLFHGATPKFKAPGAETPVADTDGSADTLKSWI